MCGQDSLESALERSGDLEDGPRLCASHGLDEDDLDGAVERYGLEDSKINVKNRMDRIMIINMLWNLDERQSKWLMCSSQ